MSVRKLIVSARFKKESQRLKMGLQSNRIKKSGERKKKIYKFRPINIIGSDLIGLSCIIIHLLQKKARAKMQQE